MQSLGEQVAVREAPQRYSNIKEFYENFKLEIQDETFFEDAFEQIEIAPIENESQRESQVLYLDAESGRLQIKENAADEVVWLEEVSGDDASFQEDVPKPRITRARKVKNPTPSTKGRTTRKALKTSSIENAPESRFKFVCAICRKGSNSDCFFRLHSAAKCRQAQLNNARRSGKQVKTICDF